MIEESFLENENDDFAESLLEDITVLQKLGVGAFSKVYKVEYKHEIYALKIVDKHTGNNIVDKLYQEAQILSTLEHPNIVQYYKTIESKRKLYFLIEYIDGVNLQSYIEQRLSENHIIPLIQQIIYAIAYIHKKGIIHRDLKPDNILIDKDMNVKIIDFGLSFQTINSTTHENCGTLIYMAPEALMKKEYFKSVDIWSLGIIQYMMFTNTHPFWIDDTRESYLKKMRTPQTTTYPLNMSKVAISFFEKTAAWEPEARISAEQALIHPWITGSSSQMPMTSKDIIKAFKGQAEFNKLIKILMFVRFIKIYGHSHTHTYERPQSQVLLPPPLVINQRTNSTYKLKTESQQFQPPLSAHRSTLSRFQNNSSFLSVQEVCFPLSKQPRDEIRMKLSTKGKQQQQFKLPPINTKSATNSPQYKSQVFTFSPYRKPPVVPESKKSQFKY